MTVRSLDALLGDILARIGKIERRMNRVGAAVYSVVAALGRFTSPTEASLSSTDHALQTGPTSGSNLAMDGDEVQARVAGAAGRLNLNPHGGLVALGNNVSGVQLLGTQDVSPTSDPALAPLLIGNPAGNHLVFDGNEFMARNGLAASALSLNFEGGDVTIGDATSRVSIPGSRHAWHILHSSAMSLPSGTWTRIVNWSTVFSIGSIAYSAGVFTVPVDGIYLIHAQYRTVSQTTSAGQRTCRLAFTGSVSGTVEGMGNPGTAGISGGSEVTQYRRMLAGDTVAFEAYQSQGAAINTISGDQYTNFSVDLMMRL